MKHLRRVLIGNLNIDRIFNNIFNDNLEELSIIQIKDSVVSFRDLHKFKCLNTLHIRNIEDWETTNIIETISHLPELRVLSLKFSCPITESNVIQIILLGLKIESLDISAGNSSHITDDGIQRILDILQKVDKTGMKRPHLQFKFVVRNHGTVQSDESKSLLANNRNLIEFTRMEYIDHDYEYFDYMTDYNYDRDFD